MCMANLGICEEYHCNVVNCSIDIENKLEANAVHDDNFSSMVIEANLFSDFADWLVSHGTTRHICGKKSAFLT